MIWKEREVSGAETALLVRAGESPLMARLLALRGVTADTLEEFFNPSHKNLLPPGRLPGIDEAVLAVMAAKRENRKTVILGDYDCDGICATAILVKTLEILEFDVHPFLPKRMEEGYGLNAKTVERLLKEHPDVKFVVTVDNGINSVDETAFLKSKGIDVVVTDHHLPPEALPECDALVDPKVPGQSAAAEELGAKNLCGAGVAFFLANMLAAKATESGIYGGEKFGAPLLVLAGIATVVDIVPLLGQNRILVANALRTFRSAAPVGLHELLLRAQRRPVDLSSRDFGFLLGPRINAAGRMASAREAFDLLMASDREAAREHAFRVDTRNAERKTVENRMAEDALAMKKYWMERKGE